MRFPAFQGNRLHVFPRLALVAYFSALSTGCIFSRAWHRLHVFSFIRILSGQYIIFCLFLFWDWLKVTIFLRLNTTCIQLSPDNSNLQGKSKKVWVIGSSSYSLQNKRIFCAFKRAEASARRGDRGTRGTRHGLRARLQNAKNNACSALVQARVIEEMTWRENKFASS